jgi:hypothetical protein
MLSSSLVNGTPRRREMSRIETVEEFLARGGRIERIDSYPDPEGRVLRRGARKHRPIGSELRSVIMR